MKPKTLIPLLAILVVLGGLVMLRNYKEKPVSITEQVRLETLLPGDLAASDIDVLELYAGANAEEKLVLARSDGDWIASTHFNAPVLDTKIQDYLKTLVELKGEFRAETDGDDALSAYDLGGDTAFHVVGKKKDSESELFHVLVGKSPNYGNAFMRAADSPTVFVTDANLRSDAGVFSENMADPPTPGTWLDKDIVKIDKDGATRLELTMPDKKLVFEWQQTEYGKAVEEAAARAAENSEGESEEPEIDVPPGPEYEWVLVEGGIESELNSNGLTSILNKLANLTGTDIVDPSKKDEWHLATPGYTARIAFEGKEDATVLEGGRDPKDTDAYLQLASDPRDIVYKINKYNFEQVFPKGSALFTLPSVAANSADVTEVSYSFDGHSVKLTKFGEEWTVVEPACDLPIVKAKPTSIAAAVAAWRAEDYADDAAGTGLGLPSRTIGLTLADGTTHSILVGNPSKHIDGHYVYFDGEEQVLTLSEVDAKKIFVEPKDLFDRGLLDVREDDINRIEVVPGGEGSGYSIERTDDGWKLMAADGEREADAAKVDSLLVTIAGLQAADLHFDAEDAQGVVLGSVVLLLDDGTERRIDFEHEQDERHPARVSGIGTTFLVAANDVQTALASADSLIVEPPAPAEEPADAAPEAENTLSDMDETEGAEEGSDES